ncbi:hypothetical protein NDU88_003430 [Pleurodeles waltl]|uniref:Uncharacterized protein n=1 Tax=Pleurodeles waltl TaxID=8319 RepID=A0AAV7KUU2_PLEWA|nr:hypothetical protein NDU88_003430 [Pleurodeles waltl]
MQWRHSHEPCSGFLQSKGVLRGGEHRLRYTQTGTRFRGQKQRNLSGAIPPMPGIEHISGGQWHGGGGGLKAHMAATLATIRDTKTTLEQNIDGNALYAGLLRTEYKKLADRVEEEAFILAYQIHEEDDDAGKIKIMQKEIKALQDKQDDAEGRR